MTRAGNVDNHPYVHHTSAHRSGWWAFVGSCASVSVISCPPTHPQIHVLRVGTHPWNTALGGGLRASRQSRSRSEPAKRSSRICRPPLTAVSVISTHALLALIPPKFGHCLALIKACSRHTDRMKAVELVIWRLHHPRRIQKACIVVSSSVLDVG